MRSVKINKKTVILSVLLIVLVVPFSISFIPYLQIKVSSNYNDEFEKRLSHAIEAKKPFDMNELTDFMWDKMYIFYPYTSREQMEETIGRSWTTHSYFGYLLDHKTILGDHPLDDESLNKLVFVRGEEVVLDITLRRKQADFTEAASVINHDKARFEIVDDNKIVQILN
ncbi:hypothetical protein [Paenibacillus turpanensis]|uniref:hypothetical protein n=1 Tax=Paenibacillus turpanensis TaxID=2689078 RepID=UPI00140D0DBD|nr:hypothetical protein [Paenibacillus turpanensis]